MRYITIRRSFYDACDAMVLLYTRYPTITPVIEEQIEDDLIEYLEAHGAVADDLDYNSEIILKNGDLTIVDPQIMASLLLKDVKEELQHA